MCDSILLAYIELNTGKQNLSYRTSQSLEDSSSLQAYFSLFYDNLVNPVLRKKTLANARGDIQNI